MSVFDGLADIFTGAFGQPVTVYKGAAAGQIFQGIYNPRSVDNFGVVQPEAMLHLRQQDAEGLTDGDLVQIGPDWFAARVQEPDGKGMVPIRLEVANAPD
jgi:hypothetical protein